MKKSFGFSLLELLVVLGTAAILLGIGAPALRSVTLDTRRTAALNGLLRAVHAARAEAVRSGREVVLCARGPSSAGCGREPADWARGWLVFVNDDGDRPPAIDAGEAVLVAEGPVPGARIVGNREAFRFLPFNRRSTNGTLVYCDDRGPAEARALVVSYTGRPRLGDADPADRAVACDG